MNPVLCVVCVWLCFADSHYTTPHHPIMKPYFCLSVIFPSPSPFPSPFPVPVAWLDTIPILSRALTLVLVPVCLSQSQRMFASHVDPGLPSDIYPVHIVLLTHSHRDNQIHSYVHTLSIPVVTPISSVRVTRRPNVLGQVPVLRFGLTIFVS